MAAVSAVLRSVDGNGLLWWCPGCRCGHCVWVGEGGGPRWGYNGNAEKPTFSPSVLVQWDAGDPPVNADNWEEYQRAPWPQTTKHHVCHTFVVDGRIQYLGDCTHALAGQTVDMEPLWADGARS